MSGQTPIGYNAVTPGGALAPVHLDASGTLVTGPGLSSTLNVTAAAVIKATPGRVARIVVVAPGATSGAFTLNDCATTGTVASSNEVWTMAYNATANVAGAIFTLDFPFQVGIVVSAVPSTGSPQLSISWV